ncbi:MAG: SsrA-binding protein SmpB [Crocinitomicaceae bacterium]|nr:SsrA-binding protein SmpB [Crocinitomicaceae bacterium]
MAVEIKNKKAEFQYFLMDEFVAGIVLTGSEIKSIRAGKANIAEAYCKMKNGELFIINMNISPYENAGYSGHSERRERKLLLGRTELNKISRRVKDTGVTIVPVLLYISEKGWVKIKIATARGKNFRDKREDVKQKDLRREMERDNRD